MFIFRLFEGYNFVFITDSLDAVHIQSLLF